VVNFRETHCDDYVEVFGPPETVSICPSHGAAMMQVVSIALPDRDASGRVCPECLDLLIWRKVALVALAIQEDAGAHPQANRRIAANTAKLPGCVSKKKRPLLRNRSVGW
jgi:hypothetical protein